VKVTQDDSLVRKTSVAEGMIMFPAAFSFSFLNKIPLIILSPYPSELKATPSQLVLTENKIRF